MNYAELSDIIKQLNVTQMDLARRLDVDGRTVRRWVSGETSIPLTAQLAIRYLLTKAKRRR
jgi:plasmid maintenance system antidote protein VapI